MFDIETDKEKQAFRKKMDQQMNAIEMIFISYLKPFLNGQFIEGAKFVSQGLLEEIDFLVDKRKSRLFKLLFDNNKKAFSFFGKETFKSLEKMPKSFFFQKKSVGDVFWAELNQWNMVNTASRVTQVSQKSKTILRDIIQNGMNEGLSHKEIAKKMRETGRITSPIRARTIALTETHTASVKAVDSAIKSTRIKMNKEWISSIDKRTRPWHLEVSGTVIPEDEMFIVKGVPMKRPGDPRGGSVNTVNCRCVLIYKPIRVAKPIHPVSPQRAKPSWMNTEGGEIFKSKVNANLYNKSLTNYLKEDLSTRNNITELLVKDSPHVYDIFGDWKHSAQGVGPAFLKAIAKRIERKKPKVYVDKGLLLDVKKGDDALIVRSYRRKKGEKTLIDQRIYIGTSKEDIKKQYIKMRALQQAIYKQEKIKNLLLYRGIGGKAGERLAKEIKEIIKSEKSNWEAAIFEMTNDGLSGYSLEKSVAISWGKGVDGVTISRNIDRKDVLFSIDTLEGNYFPSEKELIVLDGVQKYKLRDLDFKDKPKLKGKSYSYKSVYKKFGTEFLNAATDDWLRALRLTKKGDRKSLKELREMEDTKLKPIRIRGLD
jgi:hypothetical protein